MKQFLLTLIKDVRFWFTIVTVVIGSSMGLAFALFPSDGWGLLVWLAFWIGVIPFLSIPLADLVVKDEGFKKNV